MYVCIYILYISNIQKYFIKILNCTKTFIIMYRSVGTLTFTHLNVGFSSTGNTLYWNSANVHLRCENVESALHWLSVL